MKLNKDKKALALILDFFSSQDYNIQTIETENGNAVMVTKGIYMIGMVFTTTTVHNKRMIKVEEIRINEKIQRNKIGTFNMGIILNMANICDVKVGLWTEGQQHLDKWYKNLGFEFIEINDKTGDYWYEKKPNDKHEDYLHKKLSEEELRIYKTVKQISKTKINKL